MWRIEKDAWALGFAALILYTGLLLAGFSWWTNRGNKNKTPANKQKGFVDPPSTTNDSDKNSTICVVGGGVIGSSFCANFLANGRTKVICSDPMVESETIKRRITEVWPWFVARGLATMDAPPFDLMVFEPNLEKAVHGVDFVQEATYEEVDHKQALLAELDRLVDPLTIISSSTSFIPWDLLVANSTHKHRIVIGHPAIPHISCFMEIYASSPEWAEHAKKLYSSQGFDVIIMKKTIPGHVFNSFLLVNMKHGMKLVQDGVCTPQEVNTTMRFIGRDMYARHFFVSLVTTIGGDRGMKGGNELSSKIKKDAISIIVFSGLKALWIPNALARAVSKFASNTLWSILDRPPPDSCVEAMQSFESRVTEGGKVGVQEGLFRACSEMHTRIPHEIGNDPFKMD